MSLIKQLWIAIIVMSVMALGSSYAISVYQTRQHLMEHLYLKNVDNASVMAMTLSQAPKDETTLELMLAAQFDTGFYQRISLIKPDGNSVINFEMPSEMTDVPGWFVDFVRLEVSPGIASVQDGWRQYGTLEIESQYQFSLVSLWKITKELTFNFFALAVLFGVVGQFFLKGIRKPLNQVVQHAEAIGDRRFVVSDVPKTLELKNVVNSMNKLSGRVKYILEQERQELQKLHVRHQTDGVTTALNRAFGMSWLSAYFSNRNEEAALTAFLLRITDLGAKNLLLGHVNTDKWLKGMVADLKLLNGLKVVCRLNGSDFLLLMEDCHDLAGQAKDVHSVLNHSSVTFNEQLRDQITIVGTELKDMDSTSSLLAVLDELLASALASSNQRIMLNTTGLQGKALVDGSEWFSKLKTALTQGAFEAQFFPVKLASGLIFHQEAMMRVKLGDEVLRAGAVLGWAKRYNLLADVDMTVLQHCIKQLVQNPDLTIAVNLSDVSLSNVSEHYKLLAFFDAQPDKVLSRLAIEFDEQHVLKQQQFVPFILSLKKYQISVGIQRCTVSFTALPELEQLGLDYVKIDATLIGALSQEESRVMVNKIIRLSHALGLQVIAEGVDDVNQIDSLLAAGFDGYTGIAVT